jgi:isopenicillin-N epimerase
MRSLEPGRSTPTSLPAAPSFGRAWLSHWKLDPSVTHLNHGTVGAPPIRVLEAQQRIRDQIERQPPEYLLRELSEIAVGMPRTELPRLRVAAREVASFLGGRGEDLVFVDNATTGMNAVFRSFPFRSGDEILMTDHAYGAIAQAAAFHAAERGAVVRTVELPSTTRGRDALRDAILSSIGDRTRLAVVEHITSESAIVLPVQEIVAGCRARGVAVVVDGAHAPGAVALDLPAIGADWYVGNLHKWMWTPRSSGILWADPRRQEGLHPPVISWGLGRGFTAEFDWVGTRDPSAYLAAPAAIAFLHEVGPERVRESNHALAWEAARFLSERWGNPLELTESMVGTMCTVPLPPGSGSTAEDAARMRDALLFRDRIEIQLHASKGRLWARVSTQIYNDRADLERLADSVLARTGSR